ncbi:MAG: hypothetical protein IIB37_05125 [Gemmatimonadetes bacterium]|nr:hypothetical protein [Gemmatimonadota bacterium]MCH8810370.1 hypothetical protein [Gemmatimonadota bacterium]
MTIVDQFESVFRSAARTVFQAEPVEIESVLVISDGDGSAAEEFAARSRSFLEILDQRENLRWTTVSGSEYGTVPDLLDRVETERPGLICTHRHLHSESWRWPYTLGEYLDVLTQATTTPVLVIPHPERPEFQQLAGRRPRSVMAMTDHLTGDHRLVNYAAHVTHPGGRLLLGHVEDDVIFERYMEAISKISTINTDVARKEIKARLLKDPEDYVDSCREGLARVWPELTVEAMVTSGHHIRAYRHLVEEHEVDLLVMNTKDEDQLAMHGLAYSLAIELRAIPLLLL